MKPQRVERLDRGVRLGRAQSRSRRSAVNEVEQPQPAALIVRGRRLRGDHIECDMLAFVWRVVYLPEAAGEYRDLPRREQAALDNAIAKLAVIGPNLGYPHTSDVRAVPEIRELRPRAGRSPWRAFYRQATEATVVIAAVGPEAQHDPKRFRRACRNAATRLAEREE